VPLPVRSQMVVERKSIAVRFYRTERASEPVREWLGTLDKTDRIACSPNLLVLSIFEAIRRQSSGVAPDSRASDQPLGHLKGPPRSIAEMRTNTPHASSADRSIIRAALLRGVISRMATVPSLMFCFTKLGLPGLTKSTPW
jgi:hypothetical protein